VSEDSVRPPLASPTDVEVVMKLMNPWALGLFIGIFGFLLFLAATCIALANSWWGGPVAVAELIGFHLVCLLISLTIRRGDKKDFRTYWFPLASLVSVLILLVGLEIWLVQRNL
jgi:hypothetical protein